MARNRISDLLQNYPFWLLDVQPSSRLPFVVLGGPLFGFSAISHPEITVAMEDVNQLNHVFPEHALGGGSVSTITLSRGSRFYDSTMYTWIDRFIQGEDVPHRDLMLIQHMGLGFDRIDSPLSILHSGLVEIVRIPGKAWMLWDCLPTRYTPGPGLDAMNSDVSISEIDIQPVEVEEFSLDPVRIADSASV